MIKPINITPLNTTNELYIKCGHCDFEGSIFLEKEITNIDYSGKIEEFIFREIDCPKCGKIIKES